MTATPRNGKIVTFYSYKGGTGRSMALANVGWILASNNYRVLLVDWDFEAPGLHRYLRPFLTDKELSSTPGLIDFFVDFATSARIAQSRPERDARWFEGCASLVRYSLPVDWDFGKGALEFVGAGRQDPGYALNVSSFDWIGFYDQLGGGVFLEALKKKLRHDYDFVLIDSRTGISDTSGICTVQMPDEVVVLFTLNNQSLRGAAAIADSAAQARRKSTGEPGIRIWPVPTRIEPAEKDRLDAAREECRDAFERHIGHLSRHERSHYWGRVELNHQAYYAYEEVLATFAERAFTTNSLLSRMEGIASLLTPSPVALPRIPETLRLEKKAQFERVRKSETTDERPLNVYLALRGVAGSDVRDAVAAALKKHRLNVVDAFALEHYEAPAPAVIEAALDRSDALLLLVGAAPAGEAASAEVRSALAKQKLVIPLLTSRDAYGNMPPGLESARPVFLFPESLDRDIARLVDDLHHLVTGPVRPALPADPDDPQKGRWGGSPKARGRELRASVHPVSEDFFEIVLQVVSTASAPIAGTVDFHLHPTFRKSPQTVPVVDGSATLKLLGWGAFTVGAVADSGHTALELDLAADAAFPPLFRAR